MSRVPQTAEAWFAARRGPHDAGLEQAFQAWHADPANARDYAQCERLWTLAGTAVSGLEISAGGPPRRHHLRRFAAVAVIVGLTGWLGVSVWSAPSLQRFSTATGEQRVVRLDDGSEVTLNTRSTLEVRLGPARRELRLLQGEAYFEVAHDAGRPFVVDTPLGSARAVGTRFNVLIDSGRVEVTTTEGKVLVRAPQSDGDGVMAVAGTLATLRAGVGRPELGPADLVRIDNWRARRVEFDRLPLADALREFSRYTDVPVRPADASVGSLPVSAVLKAGDLSALRATLRAALGLQMRLEEGVWVVDRAE